MPEKLDNNIPKKNDLHTGQEVDDRIAYPDPAGGPVIVGTKAYKKEMERRRNEQI